MSQPIRAFTPQEFTIQEAASADRSVSHRSLKIFHTVATIGGFNRAADELGIPASEVRLQFHRFESAVGASLAEIISGIVILNSAGVQATKHAGIILEQYEAMGRAIHDLH
jgi:DNA-binding transcriptional LysR family regulator